MGRSGIPSQAFSANEANISEEAPMAFLLYYGPAWVQRASQTDPLLALRALAMVYRLARNAWTTPSFSHTAGIANVIRRENVSKMEAGTPVVRVEVLKKVDIALLA